MNYTDNYELIEVEGTDLFNPLTQVNPNFSKIDEVMKTNEENGVTVATELKSGTVHALTRVNPDVAMMRFVATSNYTLGDSFTVDGVAVTALTPDGQALPTGAYVINQSVLAVLVGSNLTIFLSGAQATDSARLGGELPAYYATASDLTIVSGVASGAATLANDNLGKITKLENINDASLKENTANIMSIASSVGAGTIYYFKKGSLVEIVVEVNSVPIGNQTLGTLPAGYRPNHIIELPSFNPVSGQNELLTINTSGAISCNILASSGSANIRGNGMYFAFN